MATKLALTGIKNGNLQTPQAGKVALKGFFAITTLWGVEPEQAMTLLGGIGKTTFYKYRTLPEVTLPNDTLERISYVLGIHKALRVLFPDEARAAAWVSKHNAAEPFNGHSALDWMLQGRVTDLADVRRYLDAVRGW